MQDSKKFFQKVEKKHIKISFGIFICFFSIYAALNYGFVSTALTYAAAFLFGNFYVLFYFGLFLLGVGLIFTNSLSFLKKSYVIFGIISIFLSTLIITSLYVSNGGNLDGKDLTLSNFSSLYINQIVYRGSEPVEVFNNYIGGGYIGFFLCALFNSLFTSYIGTLVLASTLFLLGLLFLSYKPTRDFISFISKPKSNKFVVKDEKTLLEETKQKSLVTKSSPNSIVSSSSEQKPNEIKSADFAESYGESSETKPDVSIAKQEDSKPINLTETKVEKPETNNQNAANSDITPFPKEAFHFRTGETVVVKRNDVLSSIASGEYDYEDSKKEESHDTSLDSPTSSPSQEPSSILETKKEENINSFLKTDAKEENPQSGGAEIVPTKTDVTPEAQNTIETPKEPIKEKLSDYDNYKCPPLELLIDRNDGDLTKQNDEQNELRKKTINEFFLRNGIKAEVISYIVGPAVTRFDIKTDVTVSASLIEKKMEDLAIYLGGVSLRLQKIIAGQDTSGIELANLKRSIVSFKEMFINQPKTNRQPNLTIPYGKGIAGDYVYGRLDDCPHILVCGTTGSGKSVFEHQLLITLMMNNSPDDLRILLIDPKQVELAKYNGVPHLLCPPIIEPSEVSVALDKLVDEMESRYSLFRGAECINLKEYNQYCVSHNMKRIPYIVVLIDEYADLVISEKTIMTNVVRVAQKARAAGISLIITTQRPSAEIIDGTIKSNIPVKVAFKTANSLNSRIVLDTDGAEMLLGHGDMLLYDSNLSTNLLRLQGSFISSSEISGICDYLKKNYNTKYSNEFLHLNEVDNYYDNSFSQQSHQKDPIYDQVKYAIFNLDYASISYIVRTFGIGFSRAGRIFEMLKSDKIISNESAGQTKGNQVLIHSQAELDDKDFEDEEHSE